PAAAWIVQPVFLAGGRAPGMGTRALVARGQRLGRTGHPALNCRPDRNAGGRRYPPAPRFRSLFYAGLLAQYPGAAAVDLRAAQRGRARRATGWGVVEYRSVLVGIILILASAAAYNSAPVLLALEARSRLDQRGTSLVAGVLQGSAGLLGMVLGAVGWVLQLLALTQISVTLAWVLGASGVVVLLLLSHWLLH